MNHQRSQTAKHLAKFIQINHAGELGALNIYRGQLFVAKFFYPNAVASLKKIANQEQNHYQIFGLWLQQHTIRHCDGIFIWAWGGFLLGVITALFGQKAMWTSTNAIESTVLNHFEQQLNYLQQHDTATFKMVQRIKDDEQQHQQCGAIHGSGSMRYIPLSNLAKGATKFAIWLSIKLAH